METALLWACSFSSSLHLAIHHTSTDNSQLAKLPLWRTYPALCAWQVDTLTPKMKDHMAAEILDAMAYLASRCIVHRDLACRNVLLDNTYTCKVSDFGLSRFLPLEDGETNSDGTPKRAECEVDFNPGPMPIRWMSPEVIQERTFSEKSDVWSFGVLLCEMHSDGAVPYTDMRDEQVYELISVGGHPECSAKFLEQSPNVSAALDACFKESPEARISFAKLVSAEHFKRQRWSVIQQLNSAGKLVNAVKRINKKASMEAIVDQLVQSPAARSAVRGHDDAANDRPRTSEPSVQPASSMSSAISDGCYTDLSSIASPHVSTVPSASLPGPGGSSSLRWSGSSRASLGNADVASSSCVNGVDDGDADGGDKNDDNLDDDDLDDDGMSLVDFPTHPDMASSEDEPPSPWPPHNTSSGVRPLSIPQPKSLQRFTTGAVATVPVERDMSGIADSSAVPPPVASQAPLRVPSQTPSQSTYVDLDRVSSTSFRSNSSAQEYVDLARLAPQVPDSLLQQSSSDASTRSQCHGVPPTGTATGGPTDETYVDPEAACMRQQHGQPPPRRDTPPSTADASTAVLGAAAISPNPDPDTGGAAYVDISDLAARARSLPSSQVPRSSDTDHPSSPAETAAEQLQPGATLTAPTASEDQATGQRLDGTNKTVTYI